MEIEELRDIWKKQSESFQPKDEAELVTMLKRRSTSIVTRLKRNVWIELIFTFLGGLGLLAYAWTLPDNSLKAISISIIILFCLYSVYYFKKLSVLNSFDPGKEHLKSNLRQLVQSLRSYLRFYRRSYSILYPVYFVLGLSFTAMEYGASGFVDQISRPEITLPLVGGGIIFFICTRQLTNWYLKKLYGNHLAKLEDLLRELEV